MALTSVASLISNERLACAADFMEAHPDATWDDYVGLADLLEVNVQLIGMYRAAAIVWMRKRRPERVCAVRSWVRGRTGRTPHVLDRRAREVVMDS